MSTDGRPSVRTRAWAAALTLLAALAAGWTLLAFAFRSECGDDPGGCDDWLAPDAIATAIALASLAAWLLGRRRSPWWLALATVALLVPLVHVLAA
jgi:hypothetical protein